MGTTDEATQLAEGEITVRLERLASGDIAVVIEDADLRQRRVTLSSGAMGSMVGMALAARLATVLGMDRATYDASNVAALGYEPPVERVTL